VRFRFGRSLHGAFGGVNGGVLAAACLLAARPLAGARLPAALDVRFLRGVPGGATAEAVVLHAGRTLTCVSVDLLDEHGRRCTRATWSFVEATALAALDEPAPPAAPDLVDYDDGRPWPARAAAEIPLVGTFGPREVARDARAIATAIRLPWDEPGTCAEAACVAADVSVGPPVARALRGRPLAIPNPDLSLRLAAAADPPATLVSLCRLERLERGLALTRLEVRAGEELVAVGISTTTALGG
jgi:hypothetical protein